MQQWMLWKVPIPCSTILYPCILQVAKLQKNILDLEKFLCQGQEEACQNSHLNTARDQLNTFANYLEKAKLEKQALNEDLRFKIKHQTNNAFSVDEAIELWRFSWQLPQKPNHIAQPQSSSVLSIFSATQNALVEKVDRVLAGPSHA